MNPDTRVIADFGREWSAFDQTEMPEEETERRFHEYFSMFDFDPKAEGFDLGCGSGRWSALVAPKVGKLHCIDPSEAIEVARRNLADLPNVTFIKADAHDIPLSDRSQDFCICLGVLHHITDTEGAMRAAASKLKPGGQFLTYLYYRFDNRPAWFRAVWRVADLGRQVISRLPHRPKRLFADAIAATIYFPLARWGRKGWPLEYYRDKSFYTMRTDALDRFGTRLEKRFTKPEIERMMTDCGLTDIRFSPEAPYWIAIGKKS